MDADLQDRKNNQLLAELSANTLEMLRPHIRLVTIRQGRKIYEPGDEIDHIYFPQSGLLSLSVPTKDGRFIETSAVGRDGSVGLQAGLGPRVSLTRAIVQITGQFSVISSTRFANMVQNNFALRDVVSRHIESWWEEAQQIAACNASHGASARLSRWLLQCADQSRSEVLPLTQETLAYMLGVRRTTVTLAASWLQDNGIIKYTRGWIHILDRERLRRSACECYQVMRTGRRMSAIEPKAA